MHRLISAAIVIVAVHGYDAPIGADSKRRFLLLHGTGTTAGAFVNTQTARGAKEFLTGVPRRVDAGGILIPPNWQYHALDAESYDGGWWEDGDKFKNAAKSIAAVEAALVENQAVGVIGHEQGATMAALVAARSALGLGPPLDFAIMCGASMPPEGGEYHELLQKLRETPSASIATLHCISESDAVHPPEQAEELAACFGPSAEVLWHDRGSAMPSRSWWKESQGFPEKASGGNRWVTQYEGPFYYPGTPRGAFEKGNSRE